MASFANLPTKELMIPAKLRNTDSCESISKQQIEILFATQSAPTTTPKPVPRPNKCTPKSAQNPEKHVSISTNIDQFEQVEMTKNRHFPAGNYMFKVNNRNTRTRCEICSKLTIKIPERR